MLELAPVRVAVIRCFGTPRALDAFPPLGGVRGRVAPDELWLIAPAQAGGDLTRKASSYLAGADPGGLVVEHGEGWSGWTLSGPDVRQAFSRLADFPLPQTRTAFLQGAVVQVPAKILLGRGRIHLIVPAPLRHHIPERVRESCGDLAVTEAPQRDFSPEERE